MSSPRISYSNKPVPWFFNVNVMDLQHFNCVVVFCIFVPLCWFFKGFLHDFGIIHRDVKVRERKVIHKFQTKMTQNDNYSKMLNKCFSFLTKFKDNIGHNK